MPYCPSCGKPVPEDGAYCPHCAQPQNERVAAAPPWSEEQDRAAFIGKNAERYLLTFKQFEKGGAGGFSPTWHWPAFFVPFMWLLYRKLYGWAMLAFLVGLVPLVGLISRIGFALSGNYLYYNRVRTKLADIDQRRLPPELRAMEIGREGGTNNAAVFIIVPLVAVAVVGILAAIAIPNFLAFRLKAKTAEVKVNLRAIRSTEVAYFAEWHTYVGNQPPTPVAERRRMNERVPWDPKTRFALLGFAPLSDVSCSYSLEGPDLSEAGFVAKATCDLDADGSLSIWTIGSASDEIEHTGDKF